MTNSERDLIIYEREGHVAYVTMAFAPHNLVDKPLRDAIVC